MAKDNTKKNGKVEEDYPDLDTNLSYDKEEDSFEIDLDDLDPDYDHPSDYNTISEGAIDDDSSYDSSNPYVGDEYADLEDLEENSLKRSNMHISDGRKDRISALDKELAKNAEDLRDDLDEEGYPKKDA